MFPVDIGEGVATRCARVARVITLALTFGCGGSTEPISPPLTLGTSVLETDDNAAVPIQKEFPSGSCVVERGSFDLMGDTTFRWAIWCRLPALPPQNFGGFGQEGLFRQVTPDSLVFPQSRSRWVVEPVQGAVVIDQDVLRVRTLAGAPLGSHEWTFRRAP